MKEPTHPDDNFQSLPPITIEEAVKEIEVYTIETEGGNVELPADIDFEALKQLYISEEYLKEAFDKMLVFINTPFFSDNFKGDHAKRAAWLDAIKKRPGGQEVFSFMKNNKMTISRLNAVLYVDAIIYFASKHEISKDDPRLVALKSMSSDLIEMRNYMELPLEEKIEFVKKADAVARRFVDFIVNIKEYRPRTTFPDRARETYKDIYGKYPEEEQ
ncbi:MAG: hypothetical protein AAB483_00125 [Patescibacteria group bacterium]